MEKNAYNPDYEQVFVEVDSKEINNNNIQDYKPYTFTELDATEFIFQLLKKESHNVTYKYSVTLLL